MIKVSNFIFIFALVGLSACGTMQTTAPDVQINRPITVSAPRVAPMALNDVQWQTYDIAGLKTLVAKLETTGQKDVILYVLTSDGFRTFAANLTEMKRYILDQKAANDFLVKAMQVNASNTDASVKAATAPLQTVQKKSFLSKLFGR
jgi:hypothetical protein